MFEVIAQREYLTTLPWYISFLLILLVTFVLFTCITYSYIGINFFKEKNYLLAFLAIGFAIGIVAVNYNVVQDTLNHYKEVEYIAKIHDSTSYNSITKNYIIIPQEDGTVILRPIEGD